jgi:hypothetical protein
MHTQPVHVARLPLFTNARARCARCRGGAPIWVIFCRGCSTVADGEHFHRRCDRCSNSWIEQTTERGETPLRRREKKEVADYSVLSRARASRLRHLLVQREKIFNEREHVEPFLPHVLGHVPRQCGVAVGEHLGGEGAEIIFGSHASFVQRNLPNRGLRRSARLLLAVVFLFSTLVGIVVAE